MIKSFYCKLETERTQVDPLERKVDSGFLRGSFDDLLSYMMNPNGDENNLSYEGDSLTALNEVIDAYNSRGDLDSVVSLKALTEGGIEEVEVPFDSRVNVHFSRISEEVPKDVEGRAQILVEQIHLVLERKELDLTESNFSDSNNVNLGDSRKKRVFGVGQKLLAGGLLGLLPLGLCSGLAYSLSSILNEGNISEVSIDEGEESKSYDITLEATEVMNIGGLLGTESVFCKGYLAYAFRMRSEELLAGGDSASRVAMDFNNWDAKFNQDAFSYVVLNQIQTKKVVDSGCRNLVVQERLNTGQKVFILYQKQGDEDRIDQDRFSRQEDCGDYAVFGTNVSSFDTVLGLYQGFNDWDAAFNGNSCMHIFNRSFVQVDLLREKRCPKSEINSISDSALVPGSQVYLLCKPEK